MVVRIGILLKGIDGLVETIGGFFFLFFSAVIAALIWHEYQFKRRQRSVGDKN